MNINILLFVTLSCSVGLTFTWSRGTLEKYGPLNLGLKMVKCDRNKNLTLDVSGINVHFYDFNKKIEKDFPINKAAQGILTLPNLDKAKRFFIFVGGFKSSIKKNTEERVRKAFEKFPNSYLIILDHSPYTNEKSGLKSGYERAVTYSYYIGMRLSQFLLALHQGGISPKSMHCIGHSLGSQILGHAGYEFGKISGRNISRITALDPAGPCFSNSLIQEQIRSGVAEYVEVYHCNAGGFGTTTVLADVDFFVNNGIAQPNCGTPLIPGIFDSPKAAQCSHKACVLMWLESIAHPERYPAIRCDKYEDFKSGKCKNNDKTIAGFWHPGNATGLYRFSTKEYVFE